MSAIIHDFRIEAAVVAPVRSYQSIALLRVIVAILVVAHHAIPAIAGLSPAWSGFATGGLFMTPAGRIEFFFVASALLIWLRHHDDLGNSDRLQPFLWRRLSGIYPLYWIVLASLLIFGATIGFRSASYPSTTTILAATVLVGGDLHQTPLAVAWTLFHEIMFYAAFACGIFNVRLGLCVAVGWLALVAAQAFGLGLPGVPDYVGSSLNLLFLFGIGGAAWLRSGRSVPVMPLGIAVLAAAAILLWENVQLQTLPMAVVSLAWGLLWAVALTVAVAFERRHRIKLPASLLTLSDASFMLYLLHYPLLSQLVHFMRIFRQDWAGPTSPGVVLAMIAGTCIATAVVAHRSIEIPLRSWLRRLSIDRSRPANSGHRWQTEIGKIKSWS